MIALLEDIRLVRGFKRSILIDLTRGKYHFIPNLLHDGIIRYNKRMELKSLQELFYPKYSEIFDEYYDFLKKNEFIVDMPKGLVNNFSSLEFMFEYPYFLENVVIALAPENFNCVYHWFKNNKVRITKNYGILVHKDIKIKQITSLIKLINNDQPNLIKLILDQSITDQDIIPNFNDLVEIKKTNLFSSEHKFYFNYFNDQWPKFASNIILFTEAMTSHSYFNMTLFIDYNGDILRHYDDKCVFGNVKSLKYSDLVKICNDEDFRYYWRIKKTDTIICMDCELRMMCIDNRIPMKYGMGLWRHENNCCYNPYIAKWKNEDGFISIDEFGFFNDEKSMFILDKEKIDSINVQLWGE